MKKWILLFFMIPLMISCNTDAKLDQNAVTNNDSKTDWYVEAKYGMFIHWGLYSELAGLWQDQKYYGIGEWIMKRARIPVKEYEKVAERFNPVKFDAEDWVLQAKNAGMKYIVITSKHHDGFAMFESKASPFNIVDATPFKRDPLKELSEACKKHGIRLGFYYSQTQDWFEPDAVGNDWDFNPKDKNFDAYLDSKVKPQLTELLTNYGDLGILWFDTPQDITPEGSLALVNWVHNLQPYCLTTSRVGNGYGDYLTLGDHQIPDSIIHKPFEVLFTHNDSWGFTHFDKNYRSSKEIIEILSETNSKGGNFLLNIGPKADGTFPEESARMLAEVGGWIKQNEEAVYGTSFSPFPDLTWGYCTSRPGIYYFNIIDWPGNGILRIPDLAKNVEKVSILASGKKLRYTIEGNDILVKIPVSAPDPLSTVIKVEYSGEPLIDGTMSLMEGYTTHLNGYSAGVNGKAEITGTRWTEEFGDWKYASFISGWKDSGDKAVWRFNVKKPQSYRLVLNYSYTGKKNGAEGLIHSDGQDLYFEVLKTGDEISHFRNHQIGIVHYSSPGIKELTINPVYIDSENQFICLKKIILIPYL